MTNSEIQFKNNHIKALQFEDEILEMLIDNNSIRETVMHLGEETFLENEGEIMAFLELKERAEREKAYYYALYKGEDIAGFLDLIRAVNDMSINGERF